MTLPSIDSISNQGNNRPLRNRFSILYFVVAMLGTPVDLWSDAV